MSTKLIDLFPTAILKTNILDSGRYDADELADLGNALASEGAPFNPDLLIGEGNMKTCFVEDWRHGTYILNDDTTMLEIINQGLSQMVRQEGLEFVTLSDSWYTVMNKGSRIHRHRHNSNVFSGTLFINMPEGSTGIAFVNPTTAYKTLNRINAQTKYSSSSHLVEAKTGDMIIYPSWLEHFVPIQTCDNRITISFNADYKRIK